MNNKVTSTLLTKTFGPLEFAFGYGSGAFPQAGYNYSLKKPLVDLILVPRKIEDFHLQNMRVNRYHYSKIARFLGYKAVCKVQRGTTGIYFNTNIKLSNDIECKYGVADYKAMLKELTEWNSLFIAGRMHKPIQIIINNQTIERLVYLNRKKAFVYGLAACFVETGREQQIHIKDILTKICRMSYMGDIRFWFGAENPRKVENLVEGNYEYLLDVYRKILEDLQIPFLEGIVEVPSEETLLKLWNENIPETMKIQNKDNALATHVQALEKRLTSINRKISFKGILCGAFSTDVGKSVKYVIQKFVKGFKKKQ